MTLAYFGIESSGLNLAIDLLILFFVVLYLALLYWTFADARRRVYDPVMVGLATMMSLFPFVGTIIYLVLRPPEYLEDVRERELEMQAAEARLHDLDYGLCPHCDYRVERDFIRCPSCLHKLKERCVSCARPLEQTWTICPYCETEVPAAAPAPRTRRRRTMAESEALERERDGSRSGGAAVATSEGSGRAGPEDAEGRRSVAGSLPASEPLAKPPTTGRASRPRPTS